MLIWLLSYTQTFRNNKRYYSIKILIEIDWFTLTLKSHFGIIEKSKTAKERSAVNTQALVAATQLQGVFSEGNWKIRNWVEIELEIFCMSCQVFTWENNEYNKTYCARFEVERNNAYVKDKDKY